MRSEPEAFIFATITSLPPPPAWLPWNADAVVGKLVEKVYPAIYTFSELSIPMLQAASLALPPMYVDQIRAEPEGFIFAIKISHVPPP